MNFKVEISDFPGTLIKRETEITHFIWLHKEDILRIKTRTRYLNSDLTPINEAAMPGLDKDFDCDNSSYVDPNTGLYADPENEEEAEGLVKDFDYFMSVTIGDILGAEPSPDTKVSDLIKLMLANQVSVIDQRQGFNK